MKMRALAAVVLSVLVTGCWEPQAVQRTSTLNFPDAGLLADGGRLYRYATESAYWPGVFMNVPMEETSAGTPFTGWSGLHDAMPERPPWSLGYTWGPEVVRGGGNSGYFLYYAATEAWDGSPFGRHAIGVAWSGDPRGPFIHYLGCCKLVSDWRGAIDPEVVFSGGRQYLLWSIDWGPQGRGSSVHRHIVAAPMIDPLRVDFSGARVILAANRDDWEHGTVEAPSMIWGGDGRWHLFYSGGNFESDYAVGWATCGATPTDPCTKQGRVWATGSAGMVNPGGTDFIPWYYNLYLGIAHGHGADGTRNPWMGYLFFKTQ
jgi:hypothetical protein